MPQSHVAHKLADTVRDLRRTLQDFNDEYRPELHYMRGPGPKWREKHLPAMVANETPTRLPAMTKAGA